MSADYLELTSTRGCVRADFSSLLPNSHWGTSTEPELKIHRIHAYPAKFPAFITTKALEYAQTQGMIVRTLADVFCGCGTVAFEAHRNGLTFWGCDLNPVATLIASAKSSSYQINRLRRYFSEITAKFHESNQRTSLSRAAHARLRYWYSDSKIRSLAKLRNSILNVTAPDTHYQSFFLCAFSNILKGTSKWLTKSIKPQVDPKKSPAGVFDAFIKQVNLMIEAVEEAELAKGSTTQILTASVFNVRRPKFQIDMIVTSPPYVTSYEYADLHQLSSLWLGFADDYRELRQGSIGSTQHELDFARERKRLNSIGAKVVRALLTQDKRIARSTAKYFLDMQAVSKKCFQLVRSSGIALFVIGNTEYKGVHIDNAAHLAQSLLASGFCRIRVAKRRMSGKILTPYRDVRGRFTKSSRGRHVYAEEFILIADKP
jgi:methylase of polypeptide subunit release factors